MHLLVYEDYLMACQLFRRLRSLYLQTRWTHHRLEFWPHQHQHLSTLNNKENLSWHLFSRVTFRTQYDYVLSAEYEIWNASSLFTYHRKRDLYWSFGRVDVCINENKPFIMLSIVIRLGNFIAHLIVNCNEFLLRFTGCEHVIWSA